MERPKKFIKFPSWRPGPKSDIVLVNFVHGVFVFACLVSNMARNMSCTATVIV